MQTPLLKLTDLDTGLEFWVRREAVSRLEELDGGRRGFLLVIERPNDEPWSCCVPPEAAPMLEGYTAQHFMHRRIVIVTFARILDRERGVHLRVPANKVILIWRGEPASKDWSVALEGPSGWNIMNVTAEEKGRLVAAGT